MRLIDADKLWSEMRRYNSDGNLEEIIDSAPTIEPTAPDRVLASDVVEGVSWEDASGNSHYIAGATVERACVATPRLGDEDSRRSRWFSRQSVADMLQGCLDRGERVGWPDGSPGCRFRKVEPEPPTLLEVLEFVYSDIKNEPGVGYRAKDMALAAIEREKAKQVSQ